MDALGAGVAALVARLVECAVILFLTYRAASPAAANLSELFHFDLAFARRVLQRMIPVAANELIWSLGITTYNIIYARIGTEAIAAVNIVATLDNLAFVIFIGMANATAILVGNQIGAGHQAEAHRYAVRSLSLSAILAVVIGGLLLASSELIFSIYKVSPEVIAAARQVLLVIALFLWIRVSNLMLFIGIFRAGGDTRIAFILDAGIIWVVGVPMALLGAFVLHLPVQWVYLMVMADEVTKWFFGMYRFASRKWIHNLVEEI
jgi:Na+-driven multidrug efflux pump